MENYAKFSKFYDRVMGDRSDAANYIRDLIELHNPQAKTLLEIACGTGGILGRLSESYDVTGLDRSPPMLAVAKQRLPNIRLLRQDMTNFRVNQRFDVIVCAFDSMNHLHRFSDWRKTFGCVAGHLRHGAIFVLDVNTSGKLTRLVEEPAWVKQYGRDYVMIKVIGGQRDIFAWNIKIFEHRNRDDYTLIAETIVEKAFPMQRITTALRAYFAHVKVFDPEGARPSDRSERLYFVCRARRR